MELGAPDYKKGWVKYASNEVSGDTPDQYEAFFRRVNSWARASNIVLGEGGLVVYCPPVIEAAGMVLFAPVMEGDPEDAHYLGPPIV